MPLKLNKLTSDDEFPGLMATLYNSYSKPYNGFWDIFIGESEEECQARYMQWHKADPTSHWIDVTDTETGQMIAGAQRNIFEENPYLETKPPMAAYWIREVVMWCGTHSEHRRRGAGLMMMKWGLDKADAIGLDSFVEATEAGYELYKAAGFVTVDDFRADAKTETPTEEWKRLKGELKFPMHGYIMWRPPGGKYEKGHTKFPWE